MQYNSNETDRVETDRVFSGIPVGDGNYRQMSSVYNADGSRKRYDHESKKWVPMGGGYRKSRRSTRARRHLKKSKRVRHTRRKQSRRHRHSRRRHH